MWDKILLSFLSLLSLEADPVRGRMWPSEDNKKPWLFSQRTRKGSLVPRECQADHKEDKAYGIEDIEMFMNLWTYSQAVHVKI